MIDLQSPEDRSAAAGEYVLGTLNDADRAAFAEALARDPALQAEVYDWQDRLLALSLEAAPATPGAQLWLRIDSALDGTPFSASSFVAASTTAPAPATTAPPRPRAVSPREAWWRRLAPWQALSAFAVAASLVMAVVLVERGTAPASGDRYLAVLQSPDDRSTGWVVEVDAARGVRLVPVAAGSAAPAGRSLQFWTKPQGAAAPTSLGLVSAGQRVELPLALLPAVGVQQLFEITLEPQGGSPLGRPTGPVLYVGRTVHL